MVNGSSYHVVTKCRGPCQDDLRCQYISYNVGEYAAGCYLSVIITHILVLPFVYGIGVSACDVYREPCISCETDSTQNDHKNKIIHRSQHDIRTAHGCSKKDAHRLGLQCKRNTGRAGVRVQGEH